MKKVIVCLIAVFILTGCTVKDNIVVNYDGSVREEVHVLQKNSIIGNNIKLIVDNKISQYKAILDYKKYEYDYERGKELSGAKVYKDYDNLCSYFKNSAFNQYVYEFMDCDQSDEFYEIKNNTEYITYCPECGNWPALDKVTYEIKLPVAADEQNADEINGTTYIWNYDKNTTNKNFYLKISKSKLKDYKTEYINELKKKEQTKKGIYFGIGIIVLLGFVIISIMLYMKHRKNNIDY